MVNTTEPWWDDSGSWIAATGGYELYRRDSQGERGGGVALCTRECFVSPWFNEGDSRFKFLWVRESAYGADILYSISSLL